MGAVSSNAIADFLAEAAAGPSGLVIEGDAGIGKTTLWLTGGRPLDTLPPLPANARAAAYLPYDELLPRTAVYVTNGGYGGVQYALRHGVPILDVLDEPRYRQASQRISADIAASGGCSVVADVVDDIVRKPAPTAGKTCRPRHPG
jgi:UDP:flavonoid glycosyltransferase YjiC (YdhE family)